MITRKMRLSMAMLTIAASVLTTGNIKADEKDTTKETNTATESKYANKAVADIYSTTTLNIRKKGSINAKIVGKMKKGNIATVLKKGSEWSKVRSGNVTGYVKNQYLVFGDEIKNFAKQNVKKVEISGIECTFLLFYAKITSAILHTLLRERKGKSYERYYNGNARLSAPV